ncbi:MAG: Ig-like domain-containing protein, partial [Streptococcus mitis]|nr:Ig-like domain-containing protein [Streptococcus mitis]
YASPINGKLNPKTKRLERIKPDGSALSSSVTFENPSPNTAAGLPRAQKDTFALASGWESDIYGRAIEKLAGQEDRYFKSAASDSSPKTKELLNNAVLNDKRLIVDRSTTGGNGYDAYAWSFRTEVPKTTTNEQIKDMKVVFGMMRSATAGANAAFANIATNPIKMWKSDVYTPTAKDQTVKAGQQPTAEKSIGNFNTLPQGTTVKYKDTVDTKTPGEKQAVAVVTYPDTSKKEVPVKVIVEKEAVAPAKPVTPQPEAPKPSTPAPDAATNKPAAGAATNKPAAGAATNNPAATPTTSGPEIVNDLAGKASTPADVTVKAPAGSTVKLYNTDGVVIGEAVANAQGVATVHPTNSLPAGEITATSTPAGGKESAKSAPITVTKTPVTEGTLRQQNLYSLSLLVSKNLVTVYPGDKIDIDVWAEGSPSLEEFSVPKNSTGVAGVFPQGHFFQTAGGATYKREENKYVGTVAETQPAGIVDVGFVARNKKGNALGEVIRVVVLESAKKYEPVAGTKVDVADSNGVSETEKNKIIEAVKSANPSLPANSQYSVDEKGNLTITYPDGSKDKIAAAYLVNPIKDTTAPAKPVVNTDLTGKAGTKTPVEVTAEKGSTVALYDKDNNKIGEATAGANGKATITPKVDIPAGNVTAKATDAAGNESKPSVAKEATPARENVAPTVSIPYSDPKPSLKEVYLYNGEEADVDITFNDDSGKIKSAALKRGGNQALNNIDGNPDKQDNEFGYTVTAINSETATPAKIKVTGQVSGIAANKLPKTETDSLKLVTRFATATDTDGAFIENNANRKEDPVTKEAVGTYLTDPGAVTFVLKAQTKKYDIKTPASADKVTVSDANNVTDKEFEKIKEKVKVEYSQNNPDARLADKKGKEVEDTSKVVDKVEKEGNKVVVTYKDGSKDTKPLSEFVTKDTTAPAKPVVETSLIGKAGTKTPVVVEAEPGSTVKLLDKDSNELGEAVAGANGKATITPTKDIPAGNVTATATDKAGNTSEASDPVRATAPVVPPTVELPYSNVDKRQIYIYTGEKTDLTFTGKDETIVKDLYLRNKGLDESDNASGYGFTIGKVTNSAVAFGEGTVSEDKKTATIKMVGVTNLRAGQKWTSFIEAKDNDGVKSMPVNEAYNVENNYELRRRKLGYVEFIVKSQTDKYDIKTPTEKVAVTDPANVTEADLAKVKEKLQLEYKKDNDDANIAKDTPVDKDGKIQSVTKDNDGNLVVTYTDGSTDTKPLTEFVTKDTKAPAKPEVKTDLTDKAGTKTPVEVSAEPGSKVELFDKDGNKLGEGVADENGKATITPTKELPAGDVTAKATDP